MSTSDNNLLNFLQKQSLFNGSPTKNVNRKMSSRSREKKSELWQGGANNVSTPNPNYNAGQSFNTPVTFNPGQNYNNNQNFSAGVSLNAGQNFTQGQNVNLQVDVQDNNAKVYYNNSNQYASGSPNQLYGQNDFKVQTNIGSPNKTTIQNAQTTFQNNTTNGYTTFSTNLPVYQNQQGLISNNYSFNTNQQQIIKHPGAKLDSNAQTYLQNVVHYALGSTNYARGQAMKRLDILADRVRNQLGSLNSKLQDFNEQMMSIVISEFNFVKSKVYEIMQETFRENQKYCRGYISTIQSQFNEDVLKARTALQKQVENIELMKIDINKPHWESNAVFVSVQFESRVNKVIDQVKGLEVKSIQHHSGQVWQMNLKRDLLDRVIMRLQKEREMAFGRAL